MKKGKQTTQEVPQSPISEPEPDKTTATDISNYYRTFREKEGQQLMVEYFKGVAEKITDETETIQIGGSDVRLTDSTREALLTLS